MDVKQMELRIIKNKMAEASRLLEHAKSGLAMNETNIRQQQDLSIQLKETLNLQLVDIQDIIDRRVLAMKNLTNEVEKFIMLKEELLKEFQATAHEGETMCDWCGHYFTYKGFERHRKACGSKPEKIVEKKNKKEIKAEKDALKRKKDALKEQLKELEKQKEEEPDPEDFTEEELNEGD